MCTPSIRCSMGRRVFSRWSRPQPQRGCPHSPSPTTATYSALTTSISRRKRPESSRSSVSRPTLRRAILRAPNAAVFAGVTRATAMTFRAVAPLRTPHCWPRPPKACTTYSGFHRSLTSTASITNHAWTARFSRNMPRESLQPPDAHPAKFTPCFAPRVTKLP